MPSKLRVDIEQFIRGIRDDQLNALPDQDGHRELASNQNYRLDRQSV